MPKKPVTDPITDQEVVFARLVLSGTMTDRRAAEIAGLNPETAAYTKSKPRVRAYMLEHREAVNQQLVDQDVEQVVEKQRRLDQTRERILDCLWEIADLEPEKTRGNMSSQVKALSLIASIEGVLPDRAASAPKKPAHPPITADFYRAAWSRKSQEDSDSPAAQEAAPEPPANSASAGPPPPVSPTVDLSQSTDLPSYSSPAETPSLVPRVPGADFVPPSTVRRSLRMGAWKLGGR